MSQLLVEFWFWSPGLPVVAPTLAVDDDRRHRVHRFTTCCSSARTTVLPALLATLPTRPSPYNNASSEAQEVGSLSIGRGVETPFWYVLADEPPHRLCGDTCCSRSGHEMCMFVLLPLLQRYLTSCSPFVDIHSLYGPSAC